MGLHDLLPGSILLAEHNNTGVYNFTNPGAISHNEVLVLFKEIVRPDYTWKNSWPPIGRLSTGSLGPRLLGLKPRTELMPPA